MIGFKLRSAVCAFAMAIASASSPSALGATMFSGRDSYMGPGTFYGPGRIKDVGIFDVKIQNIGFASELDYVTPFVNNGPTEPNICGETEIRAGMARPKTEGRDTDCRVRKEP